METNYYDISYTDALDEILAKIHLLKKMLNGMDSLQSYMKASSQILRPLRTDMLALDQIQEEDRETYFNYLIKEYEHQINGGENYDK